MVVRSDHIINSNLWQFFPVINVDRVKDIPCDYPGAMGVPITFMDKLNREQFEILDCVNHVQLESGRHPYKRLVVRNLHPDLPEYIDLADWFRKMGVPLYVEFMDGVGSLRRSDGVGSAHTGTKIIAPMAPVRQNRQTRTSSVGDLSRKAVKKMRLIDADELPVNCPLWRERKE